MGINKLRVTMWRYTFVSAALMTASTLLSGFYWPEWTHLFLAAFVLICALFWQKDLLKYKRFGSVFAFFEVLFAFTMMCSVSAVMSYIVMANTTGWSDQLLATADDILGFSWPSLYAASANNTDLHWLLRKAYLSCFFTPYFIFILLCLKKSYDRLYRFMLAYGISLSLTVAIFCLFPAQAAFVYYGTDAIDAGSNTKYYTDVIAGLRDGTLRSINPLNLAGIITFPSFHAAMAVLFVWATWPVTISRIPMIALNGSMWISSIPIGHHYVVDLFGGTGVAVVGIICAKCFSSCAISVPAHPVNVAQTATI